MFFYYIIYIFFLLYLPINMLDLGGNFCVRIFFIYTFLIQRAQQFEQAP